MADRDEIQQVVDDLSWLTRCTCYNGRTIDDFFVEAGHRLAADVLEAARRCPSRRQEVIWAYVIGARHGHFGGLSPRDRARMTLDEALEFVEHDTAVALATTR